VGQKTAFGVLGRRSPLCLLFLAVVPAFAAAPAAQAAAPLATTGQAGELHFSRAVVDGQVNPSGASLEECVFEYGETSAYGKTAPCEEPSAAEVGSGTEAVQVHAQLTGLKAETEYHFRLSAKNGSGAVHGTDAAFTTLAPAQLSVRVEPVGEYVLPGTPTTFRVIVENTGADETSGQLKIKNLVPEGLSVLKTEFRYIGIGSEFPSNFELAGSLCPSAVECRFPGILSTIGIETLKPGQRLVMVDAVQVPAEAGGELIDFAEVSGGGAPRAEGQGTTIASSAPSFGHLGFGAYATNAAGEPYTQAGGHPFEFSTEFNFATLSCLNPNNLFAPEAWGPIYFSQCPLYDPKDVSAEFPPGLVANPQAVPHCPLADYFAGECEIRKVAVGTADLRPFAMSSSAYKYIEPVLNLEPSNRYPGELGILVLGAPFIVITTGIRDGGDYGVSATNAAIQSGLNRFRLNLWGVPADPAHDSLRGKKCEGFGGGAPGTYYQVFFDFLSLPTLEEWCSLEETKGNVDLSNTGGPAETPEVPFITMPTECSGDSLTVRGSYNSWQRPDLYAKASSQMPPVEACNALSFEPTIEARPTTSLADAPSGLEFNLHVPQNEDPQGVATPELSESVVTLPAGVRINPASANGRAGCSEAQANLHVEGPSACPDASKLGEAEIISSLLHEPLKGSIFLATPHHNPFGSLLAVYLSVEGQGIRIKTPGRLELDQRTGQITTVFPQNPQLPFEDLRLRFFGGALGALRTPTACGVYETTSSLTPFSSPESGPPATPSAGFETTEAESGGPCPKVEAEAPNAPRFTAGTEAPQAGAYSPFSLKLVRDDGSQEATGVETTLPPGLTGKLAGISYCPPSAIAQARSREHEGGGAEEQADPSCPAASKVGAIDIASGAGPTPIHVPGRVYLAGPFKGAPLSFVIVTPALAGPFDLGTVVVRVALRVDPETTQITAASDAIPHIIDGVPLDVRQITLRLTRHDFTLNPTNCEEFHFTGAATSSLGVIAPLTQRFQVGGCRALPFKPKLALHLTGGTKRRGHPAITTVLKMPAGGANIASTQVALSSTELLDNAHINSPCTRVQFAADACPAESVLGSARAQSPLLDQPLEGPVYLMTGFGHLLPDLVIDLRGQIHIVLDARIDQFHGGLRTTFASVPDAPVSKFVLTLQGGRKGLVQNSVNLCKSPQRASALFTGQNGSRRELNSRLLVRCAEPKKHRHRRTAHRHGTGVAQGSAGR
jgi:hypothetical protein